MFSWSKQKNNRQRNKGKNVDSEENEFGIKIDKGPSDKQLEAELRVLAGVNDELLDDNIDLNKEDEDEESELLRLIGGKAKKSSKKPVNENNDSSVDATADILADIDSMDDVDDLAVDENDPDLLNELLELTGNSNLVDEETVELEEEKEEEEEGEIHLTENGDLMLLLKERIKMYKTAENKAKENNESSRARRFNRGLKTLENLLKKVKAGEKIMEGDIPPVIALNLKPLPSVETQSFEENNNDKDEVNTDEGVDKTTNNQNQDSANNNDDIMTTLLERLKIYKIAEEKAKEACESSRVRRFNRGIKTIENLIKNAKQGKTVLLTDIPPEVALNLKPVPIQAPPETSEIDLDHENPENQMQTINLDGQEENKCNELKKFDEKDVTELLYERLDLYEAAEEKAKKAGEISRARSFSKGIEILLELIEKAKAGEKIHLNDIPPPLMSDVKQSSDLELNASDNLVQFSGSTIEPIKFMAFKKDDDDDDDDDADVSLDEELLDEKTPTTVMEGLEQRLRIYNKLLLKSKQKGNNDLVRESEKIIKIYENTIETYKHGGFIDVLKLPTPKGCPPIPIPFQIV